MNPRLWFGIVVLGSAFALGAVSVHTVQVLNSRTVAGGESVLRPADSDRDLFTPVEIRIEEREKFLSKIKDPNEIKSEQRYIATLYQEMGDRSIAVGRLAHSEAALLKAKAYDPENPQYAAALANLYSNAAQKPQEASQGAQLMASAAENWEAAERMSRNSDQRLTYQSQHAIARCQAAKYWANAGQNSEAKQELDRARTINVRTTEVRDLISQVERLLLTAHQR